MKESIITGYYESTNNSDWDTFFKEGIDIQGAILEAESSFDRMSPSKRKEVLFSCVYTANAIQPETDAEAEKLANNENYFAPEQYGSSKYPWYIPTPEGVSELECVIDIIEVVTNGVKASDAEKEELRKKMIYGYRKSLGLDKNSVVQILAHKEGNYFNFYAKEYPNGKYPVIDDPKNWKIIYTFKPVSKAEIIEYAKKYKYLFTQDTYDEIIEEMVNNYDSCMEVDKAMWEPIRNLRDYENEYPDTVFPG